MTTRNLEVAIAVKADLAAATQELQRLDRSLDQLATSGKATATDLRAAATAADTAARATGKLAPATTAAAGAMQKAALSAKQLQQAQRQLPMQMTDIATGLASGQSAFMVAIQQGGQLRDSFGGVGPAARALMGAINPMVVGVTAGAAAFALIGKALLEGYQEMQAYERALISTGNVAGTTAAQLAGMADRVGEATGGFAEAEAAALSLAQSGKISEESLERATTAAVSLAQLTGTAVEDAANQIATLAEKPSAALLKLNDRYHFLTAAIYDQVHALEEQGRTEEAIAVAIDYVADVHEQRVQEMQSRLGYLERAANTVKGAFREMWDGLKGIGRDDPEAEFERAKWFRDVVRAETNASVERRAKAEVEYAAALQALNQVRAGAKAEADKQRGEDEALAKRREAEKAKADWDRLELSNLDKKAKLEREIAEIRKTGETAGKSEAQIQAQIAAARARYAESLPKGTSSKGPRTDAERDQAAAERELENLRQQAAMLGQLGDGEKRVSEEARIRYEIEQGAFQASSAATKAQLLEQARAVDAERARREELTATQRAAEEVERAYERMLDELRTPAEVSVDRAIEQLETLRKAADAGVGDPTTYAGTRDRILQQSVEPPPDFAGLSPEIGGFMAEQTRLDEARAQLEQWYAEQLAAQEQFRLNKEISQQEWNERERLIEQEHQEALGQLNQAQSQLLLAQGQSAFDSLAQMAKAFGGEQSKTYKVLFAISKGFAVAQAAVDLASNVSKAMAVGWPANIPLIGLALSQGAQITSMLSAAQYASGGRIRGPGTGTSDSIPILASNEEYMIRARSARQPGAVQFLDDFNARGMAALEDWRGYAEGGLITSAPEPRARFSDASALPAANVSNKMRVYLLQNEDALAERLAQHPATEKAIVAIASQNGNAIRAEW